MSIFAQSIHRKVNAISLPLTDENRTMKSIEIFLKGWVESGDSARVRV